MRVAALKRVIAVGILAGLLAPGIAPGATMKTRTVKEDYVGSADPFSTGLCRTSRIPTNVGKVCVPLKARDRKISISIADQVLGSPAFFYMFLDAEDDCLGQSDDATSACPNAGSACGSLRLAKPKGAVRLEIFPSGVLLGTLDCTVFEPSDSPGPAVAGKVTVKIQYLA